MKKSKARRALLRERKQARAEKLLALRAVLALEYDGVVPPQLRCLDARQTEYEIDVKRRRDAWATETGFRSPTGRTVSDRVYRYQNLPYPKP